MDEEQERQKTFDGLHVSSTFHGSLLVDVVQTQHKN